MAHDKICPKEQALRDMREAKLDRKPAVAELRKAVVAVKLKPRKVKKAKVKK